MSSGPVLLLDSASLYYRAFYALPDSMTAPDGRPHQALRGFLSMVDALHHAYSPSGVVACWDFDWRPQWRVDLLPSYKTHRVLETTAEGEYLEDEPDTLGAQVDALADLLDACGVARIGIEDFEADDVVASLASQTQGDVIVVSGDRDLVQLVNDDQHTKLLLAVNGGMVKWPLLDEHGVMDRYGVHPANYVDYAILRGDPSDGIPGVPGIGEKTAAAMIGAFGNLEGVMRAAKSDPVKPMTPRFAALLIQHETSLGIARQVATAVRDLNVSIDPRLPLGALDADRREQLVTTWGISRYLPKWM
jgi:5'-3' exonuclease